MKDDNAPISAYSIRENSKISIIGGETLPPQPARAAYNDKGKSTAPAEPRTEQSTLAQIHAERDGVRNGLSKEVDEFLSALPSDPQANALGPERLKSLQPTHARLSELLLQSLLRLDAVNAEGTWEEARKERKEAVREVQKVLDRLDGAWWTVKGRG